MKHYLINKIIFFLLIIIMIPAILLADLERRDGNWWREQDRLSRSFYVTGFFDGMDLGYHFSFWGFFNEKNLGECYGKVAQSYRNYNSKYFSHVTSDQLVDGLDAFYSDFKNRSILVTDALWLVVNGIAGTPQEKLDKMIENWRSNSNTR